MLILTAMSAAVKHRRSDGRKEPSVASAPTRLPRPARAAQPRPRNARSLSRARTSEEPRRFRRENNPVRQAALDREGSQGGRVWKTPGGDPGAADSGRRRIPLLQRVVSARPTLKSLAG